MMNKKISEDKGFFDLSVQLNMVGDKEHKINKLKAKLGK